jgi:hypothetical protein
MPKKTFKRIKELSKNPKYALSAGAAYVAKGYNRLADLGITEMTGLKKGGKIRKKKR